MYEDDKILEALKNWVSKRGPHEALSELTKKGVGARTASGLVSGSYSHRPSSMLRKVLIELLGDELRAS